MSILPLMSRQSLILTYDSCPRNRQRQVIYFIKIILKVFIILSFMQLRFHTCQHSFINIFNIVVGFGIAWRKPKLLFWRESWNVLRIINAHFQAYIIYQFHISSEKSNLQQLITVEFNFAEIRRIRQNVWHWTIVQNWKIWCLCIGTLHGNSFNWRFQSNNLTESII